MFVYSDGAKTRLKEYRGEEETVAVPEGTKAVGYGAFRGCKSVKNIVLPDSVCEISHEAFENCTALERVNIPRGVTEIFSRAFAFCTALKEIELPEGLTYIGPHAFEGCKSLKRIEFPQTVTEIDDCAFTDCTALEEAELPAGLLEFGTDRLASGRVFAGCTSLKRVVFPVAADKGFSLFENCTALETVVFPEGVSDLGSETFRGCTSLKKIVIPAPVKEIHSLTFCGCTALEEVAFPEGVETIHLMAFSDCASLKRLHLPASVKKIDRYAFADCTALAEAHVPEDAEIEENAFDGTPVRAEIQAQRERREEKIRAFKERPRRRLSREEVRKLDSVLVENNACITALRFYSGYRPLSGGRSSDEIATVDRLVPLSFMAGKEPYFEFGMYVRAVVDDIVYLTKGLEADAEVYVFDEDGNYFVESGHYDTEIHTFIRPVRK